MRLLSLPLLLTVSLAFAQNGPADQLARSLRLPGGTYESATTSALLNTKLPREGARLRTLSELNAEYLKSAFTDLPAQYGYRCGGEREVTLLPGTPENARTLSGQLTRLPGTQPLYQSVKETLFSVNGNTFASLSQYGGLLSLAVCKATHDLSNLSGPVAAQEAYAGNTASLLRADHRGRLTWCSAAGAARAINAFAGSVSVIDVSPDGRRVAVAGWDAQPGVKVYDTASGALLHTLPLKDGAVSLSFSGDANSMLVLDANRTYTWFDVVNAKPLNSWSVTSLLTPQLIGGGSSLFIERTATGPLRVYDAKQSRSVFSLYNVGLSDVTFSADGQWIVTTDKSGVLTAYSARDGKKGPTASLGTLSGAALLPGRSGAEVLVLTVQSAEGAPAQVVASAWMVGADNLTETGRGPYRRDQSVVVSKTTGEPVSFPPCLPPAS